MKVKDSLVIKQLKVMDEVQGAEDFGQEVYVMMVSSFEKTTFDTRMKQMLEGMMEQNWASAMVAAHTMKGSCGYIYAQRFMEVCKTFQEFVKNDCERLEYAPTDIGDINRPSYKLLSSFDNQKKLKGYELFFPFMEEAKSLKKEMSRVSSSQYAPDIYDQEIQQIQMHYDDLKSQQTMKSKKIQILSSQSLNEKVVDQVQQNQKDSHTLIQSGHNSTLGQQESKNNNFDPPQSTKCCDKCNLF